MIRSIFLLLLLFSSSMACLDVAEWKDEENNDCKWYRQNHPSAKKYCDIEGDPIFYGAAEGDPAFIGMTVQEACCQCGGGVDPEVETQLIRQLLQSRYERNLRGTVDVENNTSRFRRIMALIQDTVFGGGSILMDV
mmetsp:Transcript_18424/g.27964  ORF Transcript_18424/g.27964 Transcript_18424/m.27964 type:complete len:136 (+) Transcript_18424:36-443(+)